MNHEKQRIAIAEACGWTKHIEYISGFTDLPEGGKRQVQRIGWKNPRGIFHTTKSYWPPDFIADLNAMHEAEKVLPHDKRRAYGIALLDVIERSGTDPDRFNHIHATAAHRAEAFLRVLSKWED